MDVSVYNSCSYAQFAIALVQNPVCADKACSMSVTIDAFATYNKSSLALELGFYFVKGAKSVSGFYPLSKDISQSPTSIRDRKRWSRHVLYDKPPSIDWSGFATLTKTI